MCMLAFYHHDFFIQSAISLMEQSKTVILHNERIVFCIERIHDHVIRSQYDHVDD